MSYLYANCYHQYDKACPIHKLSCQTVASIRYPSVLNLYYLRNVLSRLPEIHIMQIHKSMFENLIYLMNKKYVKENNETMFTEDLIVFLFPFIINKYLIHKLNLLKFLVRIL